jgi:hypothetical protein
MSAARIRRMAICRLIRLAFMVCVMGTAACLAQTTLPPQIPSPTTRPALLSGYDLVPEQCKGVTTAEVKIEFVVSTAGDPTEVHVLTSPSDKHSACAMEMIHGYKYLPAMRDGKAVAVKLILTLTVKDKA